MTSRELFIALVIAVLLGGAFIGVLAVVGDDPAPVPTRRGFTATASETNDDHYNLQRTIEDSLGLGTSNDPYSHPMDEQWNTTACRFRC